MDRKLLDQFVSYFATTKAGQECVLAIWLGDRPVEDQLRKRLVSRAYELLK